MNIHPVIRNFLDKNYVFSDRCITYNEIFYPCYCWSKDGVITYIVKLNKNNIDIDYILVNSNGKHFSENEMLKRTKFIAFE